MRAIVFEPGKEPSCALVDEPVAVGELQDVTMLAAAITGLDVLIASGRHAYSPTIKAVMGREGVCRGTDGARYFLPVSTIPMPNGSMAERTVADLNRALPVPDGVSDAIAAAVGNIGLAAWLPLSWRGRLAAGETVLVLGATSATGRIAVAAARALGAGRVIACGRDEDKLAALRDRGADDVIRLAAGLDLVGALREAAPNGVDVVLDYLNGRPVEAALEAMAVGGRVIQIGSVLGTSMTLPVMTAKVRNLDVLGFGYHFAPLDAQRSAYRALCVAAVENKFDLEVTTFDFSEFAMAWRTQTGDGQHRCVLMP